MAHVLVEELTRVDRIWHLSQTGLVDGLSPVDLSAIVSGCTDRMYSKEEIIFDQGDSVDSVFILNRGCVRISMIDPGDKEKILGIYTHGILGIDHLARRVYRPDSTANIHRTELCEDLVPAIA